MVGIISVAVQMPPLPLYKKNITFCPFQVQPIVFLFIPVSFRLISLYSGTILVHSVSFRCQSASFHHIPVHSIPFLCLITSQVIPLHCGIIPARSGIFWHHSCPFHFIPASFCLVSVHSGLFRYIPFRSIPFLCLVTPFTSLGFSNGI